MNALDGIKHNEKVQSAANTIVQSTWFGRKVDKIVNPNRGSAGQDIEVAIPSSHGDDGSAIAGGGTAGGGITISSGTVLCAMLLAGVIMWGVGSANCDEPTFQGWGESGCNVQNTGAIMTITSCGIQLIACAVTCCCLAILCPLACCAALAADSSGF